MIKLKTVNSTELLKKQLKNKNFKKEYNSLEAGFSIAKEIIHLKKNAHLTQTELAKKATPLDLLLLK